MASQKVEFITCLVFGIFMFYLEIPNDYIAKYGIQNGLVKKLAFCETVSVNPQHFGINLNILS
jgi:hypothetical protein